MYCKYCGKTIDEDSIFCKFCRKQVKNNKIKYRENFVD